MKRLLFLLPVFLISNITNAQPDVSKTKIYKLGNYELQLSPGISAGLSWDALSRAVLKDSRVKALLVHSKYKILSQEIMRADKGDDQYLVTVYDYTNNICLLITLSTATNIVTGIIKTEEQPNPSDDEFEMALQLALQSDKKLNDAYQQKLIAIYKPMPPVDLSQTNNGKIQRTIPIGIEWNEREFKNEIIGVNMISEAVIHYANGAPPTSRATNKACGIDDARQKTTRRMTDGSMWFSVKTGGEEIWKFLVARPAASSGLNASGVELQYVSYMGRSVLRRAAVPVLNVKYDNDACGPYRDWLYNEGMFQANGEVVAPGFIICTRPPKTLLQSENDTGNFSGVAVYATDSDLTLTSEMEAGWYRYIMEWHFRPDGSIEPRFEFSAVKNSCVCKIHHHHVYWRFDFDIDTAKKNQVEEFNKGSGWTNIDTEERRLKDSTLERKWRISNTETGAAYILRPGDNDGIADEKFGVADVWILHDNGGSEIDDGIKQSGHKQENIDQYLNGENTHNTNIVVWYSAHFTHDVSEIVDHKVGPKLICVRWPVIAAIHEPQYAGNIK